MITWLTQEAVVLCVATVLLSVLAALLATHEVRSGRGRNPLETDPRHRRHRRRQRVRSRAETAGGAARHDTHAVIADVAATVRRATEPSAEAADLDHEAATRALVPAARRLDRPLRSRELTAQQRERCRQFQQLIRYYVEENGEWHRGTDRHDLRETLHRTARRLHRRYARESPGDRDGGEQAGRWGAHESASTP